VIFFIHIICLFNFIQGAQASRAAGGAGDAGEKPNLVAVVYSHWKINDRGIWNRRGNMELEPEQALNMPLCAYNEKWGIILVGFKFDDGSMRAASLLSMLIPPTGNRLVRLSRDVGGKPGY
jgi:hypothetical protein